MALWGHTSGSESKPNYLSTAEKDKCQATAGGWELSKSVGSRTLTERLVAMRSLTTKLGAADITKLSWVTTAADKSAGFTLEVKALFNEAVDVTGAPQLSVTNGNQGTGSGRGPHALVYYSGTGTNELTFRLVIAAANAATNENDVLSIGTNPMSLSGGTIKDKGTATVSTITSVAGIGSAAGTVTVVA